MIGESAGEEKIEPGVLIATAVVYVVGRVPGIDGGNAVSRQFFSGRLWNFSEFSAGIADSCGDLLNSVTNTIADIF